MANMDERFRSLDVLHAITPASTQVLPFSVANVAGTDFDTTLFLTNTSETEASVSVTAYEAGSAKGTTASITLAPRSRMVLSVNEIFPASMQLGLLISYLEVSSSVDVGLAALISSDTLGAGATVSATWQSIGVCLSHKGWGEGVPPPFSCQGRHPLVE
jgi:hypothetical protein